MANCNQATPDLTPEAMLELIKQCPPGPWPNAWGTWDNTIEAHRRLVDQYVDNLMPSRVTYAQERGIVIAGGGLKYFPSVWVNVNLLRHFGCTLPIQLWYLGDTEMDPYMKRLLEPLGVECIDAREIEKQHPCRILCGWELKLYATLHSPFAQVLFLDADNGVVCDPTYLFDCEEYKRHGAIFWPDYACWTLKPGVWKVFGMMARHQIVIALANVLKNAYEAFQAKGTMRPGAIRIAASTCQKWVTLTIEDTGQGICDEELRTPLLLTPGRRNKSKRQSTGYGLPIAARNVAAHGGLLRLESRENEGTTVTILLPRESQ